MTPKRLATLRHHWASLSQFLVVNRQAEPSSHEERVSRYTAPAITTQNPRFLAITGVAGLFQRATKIS